jgi:hypothetical protein
MMADVIIEDRKPHPGEAVSDLFPPADTPRRPRTKNGKIRLRCENSAFSLLVKLKSSLNNKAVRCYFLVASWPRREQSHIVLNEAKVVFKLQTPDDMAPLIFTVKNCVAPTFRQVTASH